MRWWSAPWMLLLAVSAWAYSPLPVTHSAAETALAKALAEAKTDSAKLQIALHALDAAAEDIPAGRAAQDVIFKLKDDPEGFFKARAEGNGSPAAHYLYGRATEDTLVMVREAEWLLAKDPQSYWGLQLAGDAEWSKAQPDLERVQKQLEASIAIDPSRPEGYLNLGYLYEDRDNWPKAREVFEAGAVCDPKSTGIRDARLTTYAELRDADGFFKLIEGVYSDKPLEADMPFANKAGHLTTAELRGQPTVLEYWAFT